MRRRLAWIVLVCLTAAGLASPVSAQAPTPGTPKAVPSAPTPTAAQSAAALELFKSIRLEASLPSTTEAMIDSEINRSPGMTPYRDIMVTWLKKYMTWKAMLPELTKLYTETFTEAELKELAAFYKTPTGQKSMKKMPELMQKTALLGAKLGQEHTDELTTLMNARREELLKQQEKEKAAAAKAPANKVPAAAPPPTPKPKKP